MLNYLPYIDGLRQIYYILLSYMSEIKKQLSDYNAKQKNSLKELELDHTQDEGCCKSFQKKIQYCTDVLANYFQCLRVFSDQKLQELRRKVIQQELESQINNKSAKSEASIQNEKYSEIQNKSQFKQQTRKQRNILIEDYNQLPANNYSTNQRLRFTKRYAQIYQQSYTQRRNRFGYSFQQVQIERERQYLKKEKNFWEEFKRFICCRGGNYIQELDQKETDYQSNLSNVQISEQNSCKEFKKQPSLNSQKNRQQNNIFLFEQQNEVNEAPQEITLTKHGKKINKNIKVIGEQGNTQKGSCRKSQNLQIRESRQGQARKVSSRLGVDTQLLIKRKQYEQKNDAEYRYEQNKQRNKGNKEGQNDNNTFNNYNENNNNYRNEKSYRDEYNENIRYEGGVEKKRGDKKDKISKMMKQIQNQNEEQFIDNQVSIEYNKKNLNKNDDYSLQYNENNKNNKYDGNDWNGHNVNNENNKNNGHNGYNEYNELDESIVQSNSVNNSNISYQRSRKSKKPAKNNINIDSTIQNNSLQDEIPDMQIMHDDHNNYNNNYNNHNDSYNNTNNANNVSFEDGQIRNNEQQRQSKNKEVQSHLIIKQNNNDSMFDNSLDQIPNVNLSMTQHENSQSMLGKTDAPAFKKKKKNKININQLENIQDKDDVIVLNQNNELVTHAANQNYNDAYRDNQNYGNTNNYNNKSNNNYDQAANQYNPSHQPNSIEQSNFMNENQPHTVALQSGFQDTNQPKSYTQQMNKKKKNKRKALVVEQDGDQDVVDLEDL